MHLYTPGIHVYRTMYVHHIYTPLHTSKHPLNTHIHPIRLKQPIKVRPTPQFVNKSCNEDIRIFTNKTALRPLRITYGKLFTYYDQFQSCADNFNTSAHTMRSSMKHNMSTGSVNGSVTGSVNSHTNWLLASLSRGAAESMEHACDQCGRLFRRYIPKLVY